MDSTSSKAGMHRRPTTRPLPSEELDNISRSRSRHAALSNKGPDAFDKPGPNGTYHLPSHYSDLRQLEPEEDLIQFDSRPPTPHTQPNRFDIPVRSPFNVDSSKDQAQ